MKKSIGFAPVAAVGMLALAACSTLGEGTTSPSRDTSPPAATHPAGPTLRLDLDPRLTWRVDGGALVGSGTFGPGDDPFRFSVEWT